MQSSQFEYGIPAWGKLCLLGFAGIISIVSGVSAYRSSEWNPEAAAWVEYALWVICVAMAGFVFVPRRNDAWVNFIADSNGIRFHTTPYGARNRWLRFNWSRIGGIRLKPYNRRSRSRAFIIEIQASDPEIEASFPNLVKARRLLRRSLRNDRGFFELRYNNPFHDSATAVERLEALRTP